MAKAQDKRKQKQRDKHKSKPAASKTPVQLLVEATEFLQQGQPDSALSPAQTALSSLQLSHGDTSSLTLPALSLVAEIQLDLGDIAAATASFKKAVEIDPEGMTPEEQGGGADKFLNLAQLDETGGQESLQWFEKAVACLEREISELDEKLEGNKKQDEVLTFERDEKREKLAHALCAMCELYMTDLSWEEDAEANCERFITQAMMLAPEDSQTLMTLGSIRVSQQRFEDAQAALDRSVSTWKDLPTGHPLVPDFAARIALTRALMTAGMVDVALEVCERLIGEDDQSIEAWYQGGWCQHLIATGGKSEDGQDEQMQEDPKQDEADDELSAEDKTALLLSGREWLRNCLKLYQMLEYEDVRLREHAEELLKELDGKLGNVEIEDEDEWEGIESGDDEEGGADEEMDES